jgi:hypothetical protein
MKNSISGVLYLLSIFVRNGGKENGAKAVGSM